VSRTVLSTGPPLGYSAPVKHLVALAVTSGLLLASPAFAADGEQAAPENETAGATAPRTRFVYRTLNVFRYNPLGLSSDNHFAMRYRLFEPDNLLFKDTYVGFGLNPIFSAGYTRLGALLEVQPLAVVRLWAKLEIVGYHGWFDHLQSFKSPHANFSDGGLAELGDLPQGDPRLPFATFGNELTLGLDLQVKLGPIAARSLTRAVRGDYELRDGDNLYYDPQYDVLAPDGGFFVTSDTDLLWVTNFGLVAGLRTNVTTPFYDGADYGRDDPRLGHRNGPSVRMGPLVAYSFFDEPGALFNKPTILTLVQWYAAHRWRTGEDTHVAIPYFVLGFAMVGDLLPWRR
jgi:hypothetical protein